MLYRIVLFVFFTFTSYSQNMKVKYEIVFKNDALENNKSTYLQSFVAQAKKDIYHYPMEFIISEGSYSIDFSNSMQVDSEFQKVPTSKKLTLSLIGLSDRIFYTNQIAYKISNDFVIKYDNNELGYWEMSNESKEILGYECFKAIYIPKSKDLKDKKMFRPNSAWITNKLPYQGGPTVFGEVPGLILEIDLLLANIKAIKIEKTDELVKLIELDKYDILSYSEAEKLYSNQQ